jgi:anti-anti-sigma factor
MAPMPIHFENRGSVVLIQLSGRIDSASAPEFEQVVIARFDEGASRVVFDFSQLAFMSSAGLRVVLVAGKRARAARGALAFAGLSPNVREVFEMSGFLKLFEVRDTLDEAIKAASS